MKKDKILVSVTNLNEIEAYKKIGITNFLFTIPEFSLDPLCFELAELEKIEGHVYLNINKIMDTKSLERLKTKINDFSFVRGIFFDDLGVYQIFKDAKIPLIWHQAHFGTNSASINFWLDKVASAMLSNELTLLEVKNILSKVTRPVIFNVFGQNMAMYSKRRLLSAFGQFKGLNLGTRAILQIGNQNEFIAHENSEGTVLYYHKYFNYLPFLKEINDEKIWFYYVNPFGLRAEEVIAIINGQPLSSEEKFLHHETIYKLEPR